MGCNASKSSGAATKVISVNSERETRHATPISDRIAASETQVLLPNATVTHSENEMDEGRNMDNVGRHVAVKEETAVRRPEAVHGVLPLSKRAESGEIDVARYECRVTSRPGRNVEGSFGGGLAKDGIRSDRGLSNPDREESDAGRSFRVLEADLNHRIANYDSSHLDTASALGSILQPPSSIRTPSRLPASASPSPSQPSSSPSPPLPTRPQPSGSTYEPTEFDLPTRRHESVFCVGLWREALCHDIDDSPPSKDSQYYSGADERPPTGRSAGTSSWISWSDSFIVEDGRGSVSSLSTDRAPPPAAQWPGSSAPVVRPNAAVRRTTTHLRDVPMSLTARF